jgi:hypothetical protein
MIAYCNFLPDTQSPNFSPTLPPQDRSAPKKTDPLTTLVRNIRHSLEDYSNFGDFATADECDKQLEYIKTTVHDLVYSNVVEQMGILKAVLDVRGRKTKREMELEKREKVLERMENE